MSLKRTNPLTLSPLVSIEVQIRREWVQGTRASPETENFTALDRLCFAAAWFRVLTGDAANAHLRIQEAGVTNIPRSRQSPVLTTGNLPPQIKMSEKDRINPIFAEMFAYKGRMK
jgi:hypothetical protein